MCDRVISGRRFAAMVTYHPDCALVGIYHLLPDRLGREVQPPYETARKGAVASARRELAKHEST